MKKTKGFWIWGCILGLLTAFFLGLALVWVNIELVDLSYSIKELQSELNVEKNLKAKLEVERMNLSSTYRLQEIAPDFGLKPPGPEQVRKLY